MDWKNLLWLGLGIGLGLVLRPQRRRSTATPAAEPVLSQVAPSPLTQTPTITQKPVQDLPNPNNSQAPSSLQTQLEELKLAYQMAAESSQFKGGFLARISHELRSPLNGLVGLHQLILSDLCDSPEEERDFVSQANTAARRMISILDEILAVARVQHGTVHPKLQAVELAQVLQEVYTLTHLQAQDRNLRLQIQSPDSNLYVLTDPLRLRQVLVHLVDSAIKHLPEGSITVSAELSDNRDKVYIWIDDHRSASDRSEPIALLSSDASPESVIPSPGLTLLLDQILLEAMQGQLEVMPAQSDPNNAEVTLTRLRCSVPVAPAESID